MNRRKFLKHIALATAFVGSAPLMSLGSSTTQMTMTRQNLSRVLVMGIGGAGGSILSNLHLLGLSPDNLIWLNAEEKSVVSALVYDHTIREVLIGKTVTGGNGTHRQPCLGYQAVLENEKTVRQLISNMDILFITAGLGGGFGSGASPKVAQWGQEAGCVVDGLFSMPFSFEGRHRWENAIECLNQFSEHSDMVHAVSNGIWRKKGMSPSGSVGEYFYQIDQFFFKTIINACHELYS
jgi:cell division GTPase FtsZ